MSTPRKDLWIIAAAVIGVLIVAAVLLRRAAPPDEQQIRDVIEQMRAAVEAKSARTLVEHLDAEYRDRFGADRLEVRRMLTGRLMGTRGSVRCLAVPAEIEVADGGREATATVYAAAYEGIAVRQLTVPTSGQAFELEVRFRKGEDGVWRVVWHDRREFSAADVWSLAFGD
jgi:hypothetical protein